MTNTNQVVEVELTEMEIAYAVFATEQEAGLHAGLTFEQWFEAKTKVATENNKSEITSLGKKEIDLGNGVITREFYVNEYGNEVMEGKHYEVDFKGRTKEFLNHLTSTTGLDWECRNKKLENIYLNSLITKVKKSIFFNKENFLLIFDQGVELSVQIKKNKKNAYWLIHE